MKKATLFSEITVIDPDNKQPVNVSMFKHENGGIFGIDSSWIEQSFDDEETVLIPDPFDSDIVDPDQLELIGF